jgi:hypothetical protein
VLFLHTVASADSVDSTDAPDEYHVKAAYLVGFSRFIESAINDGGSNIVICSAGDERMLGALQRVVAGRISTDQHVSLKSVDKREDVRGCTVLFVSLTKIGLLREVRKCDAGVHTLTVGDSPGFLEAGGAIEFVWAGNKIQFNASLPAIRRSGLKLSSRMLNLARNLRNDSNGAVR